MIKPINNFKPTPKSVEDTIYQPPSNCGGNSMEGFELTEKTVKFVAFLCMKKESAKKRALEVQD